MIFCTAFCILLSIFSTTDAQPAVGGSFAEVTISTGRLRGRQKSGPGGSTYFSFTAIPYATAPVGPFRFKPPSPAASWDGVLDVSSRSIPSCIHLDVFTKKVEGVEDCLVVNVFTPADVREKVEPKLPVMVWIHGGGYVVGNSRTDLFSPGHFVARNVIMVSMNYRLSSLGFLSTGNSATPGNYGILDQIEALHWVQKNIAAFGGDPNQVTIFGVSAGGASVHNLVLTPLAKGLFKRAISQSGTSLCPWSFEDNGPGNAKKLAEKLECPTDTPKKMMHCLRSSSAVELVKAAGSLHKWFLLPLSYGPVLDGGIRENPVFPKAPVDLLTAGDYNQVPWINGIVADEGFCMTYPTYFNATFAKMLDEKWVDYCPLLLDMQHTVEAENMEDVCSKAREQYLGAKSIPDNLDLLTKMSSDRSFKACAKLGADLQSKFSPVYMYAFEYEGTLGWLDLVIGATKLAGKTEGLNLNKPKGVPHADDMFYMFDMELFHTVPRTESDKRVLAQFMDLWTNFAKFGNPTPDHDDRFPVKWLPYDETNQPVHYVIDGKALRLSNEGILDAEDEKFWASMPIHENVPGDVKREEL